MPSAFNNRSVAFTETEITSMFIAVFPNVATIVSGISIFFVNRDPVDQRIVFTYVRV